MNPLIRIQLSTVGPATVPTCNARDLHEFLQVGRDFSTWIKDRIEEYDFEEGKDFCSSKSGSKTEGSGGHNRKDYFLSLDMAKELSMVERTEKGKQARQYFIECERQAKAGGHIKILPPTKQTTEASKTFNALFRTMRLIGLDKNAAAISANQATRKVAGLDLLDLSGNTHLVAENQDSGYSTPTDLGKPLGLSAIKVNRLLAGAGLQERIAGEWEATPAGRSHSRRLDTFKRHSDGTPVTQLKWASSVLPLILPPPVHHAA